MSRIFLSLGSNLGDRRASLERAVELLTMEVGQTRRRSAIYETEPWADTPGSDFLNMVVELKTHLEPMPLLEALHTIETACGRIPSSQRFAPRIVDMDILFYGSEVFSLAGLTVPHPSLHERRFVLVPMNEIAPAWKHPVIGATMKELLAHCTDEKKVWVYGTSGAGLP